MPSMASIIAVRLYETMRFPAIDAGTGPTELVISETKRDTSSLATPLGLGVKWNYGT